MKEKWAEVTAAGMLAVSTACTRGRDRSIPA